MDFFITNVYSVIDPYESIIFLFLLAENLTGLKRYVICHVVTLVRALHTVLQAKNNVLPKPKLLYFAVKLKQKSAKFQKAGRSICLLVNGRKLNKTVRPEASS